MPLSVLDKYAASFFKYEAASSVRDWAEANVELSSRISEQPGPYSTALYPYANEILECIADPTVKRVSLCWGSQTSKTTTFYVMLGYVIDKAPKPILWVFPTAGLCRTFAGDRWLPFCRESSVLNKHIAKTAEGNVDPERFALQRQEFSRCTMNLVGAGSQANVRSYPVSILVLDEIDIIDELSRREAMDRIKGKHDYKILQSSTPLLESGGIWQEFMDGDRRRFFMQCPHCSELMVFRFFNATGEPNIRFAEASKLEGGGFDLQSVQLTSRYVSECCGKDILDSHKSVMLQSGRWLAGQHGSEIGFRSYHLNSIYSPIISFGRIMVEYLKSKASPGGSRAFVNGWLAEPWKEDIDLPSVESLRKCAQDYPRGTLKGDYRLMAVDVQRTHFVYVVRGLDGDGHSFLVDHGLVPTIEDLDAVVERFSVSNVVIDTRYRTNEIYGELFKRRASWIGVKGLARMALPYKLIEIDPFEGTNRAASCKIPLLYVAKELWQEEICRRRSGVTMNWWCYSDPCPEYMRQVTSVWQEEEVDKRGRAIKVWKNARHGQDHMFDCECYLLALSRLLGFGGALFQKPRATRPPVEEVKPSFWD